jgi:hypothetical protein
MIPKERAMQQIVRITGAMALIGAMIATIAPSSAQSTDADASRRARERDVVVSGQSWGASAPNETTTSGGTSGNPAERSGPSSWTNGVSGSGTGASNGSYAEPRASSGTNGSYPEPQAR